MIYPSIPENFSPMFRLASNFVWHDGKMLLLHRHEGKSQGGKWGQPAGKIESGESDVEAAARELFEETGIVVGHDRLEYWTYLYVCHDGRDFSDALFTIHFDERPEVNLNRYEHQDYGWFTPEEAFRLHLVDDFDECIRMFLSDKNGT